MISIPRLSSRKARFSSSASTTMMTGNDDYRHRDRHRERSKLVILLENRSLQLSREILSDDQSPIADRIAAIKEEARVWGRRDFIVSNNKLGGKGASDLESGIIDEILRSPAARTSERERLKIYRREAEREERRLWLNMNKLEKLDDRRFLMKQIRSNKRDRLAYSHQFENSYASILSEQLLIDLVAAGSKVNKMYGLGFGQPLVVDMGLPYKMTGVEVTSFYSQMKEFYLTNQTLLEPYNLFLCNFDENDEVATGLLSSLGDEFLWNVTPKCFTQLFPLENLVYMTPDSPNVMTDFRYDDVFIFGACVDVDDAESGRGISYEKVTRLGIRSARLDLDSYFDFGNCRARARGWNRPESLPLLAASDVFTVIADARESRGDWDLAHRTLIGGRKRVLKWKSEKEDLVKKMNDVRFQRILENVKSS